MDFSYFLEMALWITAWEGSSYLFEKVREWYNKRKGNYYYEYEDEEVKIKVQGKNKNIVEKLKKLVL